ncbi:hypothetical protein DFJ74DRAFT_690880 [Hyaloraphidium curvatum]|nr:hypothetical protein DFJ74DRAFT_690880 [Hyaloraphidium curvatum]
MVPDGDRKPARQPSDHAAAGAFPMPRPARALFDFVLGLLGRSRSPAEQSQLIEQSVNATIKVWSQWRQFKSFVNQGRIVETSIAVVIGDSFKDVVRSFVNDVLLPPIQWFTGGSSFSMHFVLRRGRTPGKPYVTLEEARADGALVFSLYSFADKLFNFFVVGVAAYYLLRSFKYFFHRYIEPETRDCPYCFSSIPKKATRCASCTSAVEPQTVYYPRY